MQDPDFSSCDRSDWHSVVTISLGELVEGGFVDWDDPSWAWDSYSPEQAARFQEKFVARYYWREIGIIPPGRWKQQFIRKLNELMPKYKVLYKLIDDGLNILQDSDTWHKGRRIGSDFPQTLLAGDQDYASDGTDEEYETVVNGDVMDKLSQFESYNDVDVMLLDDLEVLFTCLFTVNVNGY